MTITIEGLSHTFTTPTGRVPALRDVSLQIRQAEFVAILGPSGCGKSTLLRLLANLLRPMAGHIALDGLTPAQAAATKRIGWMAQHPALLPWYTVRDNIALAQRINPQPQRAVPAVDDLLALVGLSDFASAYPFTLSGGMQQRAGLARTLALGADVWLMDEPFAALDELTRESLTLELLRLWQTFRPTVLWVTHHIQETVRLADRVVVMSRRPGHVHTEKAIGLPRPRDDTAPDFQPLVRELRVALAAQS
ncbi:MAG: ABC transporter ATP-binding protein [Anaerolineae bacterium]|nr:ABC transporter ATP-binding protein [Anaerolineae bacterium]